jgi:hypothetical protein
MADERVREPLRAAARQRPSRDVAERAERQADARGQRTIERAHAVRRDAAEQRFCRLVPECRDEALDRSKGTEAELRERKRMARDRRWTEDRARQRWPVGDDRADQPFICVAVAAETRRRFVNRTNAHGCVAGVERMRDHDRRFDPFESVRRQGQRFPERGLDGEWMNGGADVVREPRKRQLRGARAAADAVVGFEHHDPAPGLRQDDGGAQAVWSGTDDDGISHAYTNDTAVRPEGLHYG